jgi:hypothetical protein
MSKPRAEHLGQGEEAEEDEVEQKPESYLGGDRASLWKSVFSNLRNIDGIREDDNRPLVEVYNAVLTELDEGGSVEDGVDQAEPGENQNLIRLFLCDWDTSDAVMPQADTIEDYSSRASLDLLKAESWTGQELPRKAWVGEGGDGWFKPCAGWLTAHGLYKALRKPVSPISP